MNNTAIDREFLDGKGPAISHFCVTGSPRYMDTLMFIKQERAGSDKPQKTGMVLRKTPFSVFLNFYLKDFKSTKKAKEYPRTLPIVILLSHCCISL